MADKIEAQPLHALPMPGTMPVSGHPALPAVDGGEISALLLKRAENLEAATFYHTDAHDIEEDAADAALDRQAAALITAQQQEVTRHEVEANRWHAEAQSQLAIAEAAESRVQSLEAALFNLAEAVDCEVDIAGKSGVFRKRVIEARAALKETGNG